MVVVVIPSTVTEVTLITCLAGPVPALSPALPLWDAAFDDPDCADDAVVSDELDAVWDDAGGVFCEGEELIVMASPCE
jgi:hypothetical protein